MLKLHAPKPRAILSLVTAGACVGWLVWYGWFTWGEVQENRYANYAEALYSQRRGWLPTMLPRSATQIHEWHDLDTNLCFGSFRFHPSEHSSIKVTLRHGRRRPIRIDRDPSFASPLPRDPNEQELASAGFEIYSAPDLTSRSAGKPAWRTFGTPRREPSQGACEEGRPTSGGSGVTNGG